MDPVDHHNKTFFTKTKHKKLTCDILNTVLTFLPGSVQFKDADTLQGWCMKEAFHT